MTEYPDNPALALAERAMKTDTAHRLVGHLVMCRTIDRVCGADGEDIASDVIAHEPLAADRAASQELDDLAATDPDAVDRIIEQAFKTVAEATATVALGLQAALGHLGAGEDVVRGLDAEHVAIFSALALLTGGDELIARLFEGEEL